MKARDERIFHEGSISVHAPPFSPAPRIHGCPYLHDKIKTSLDKGTQRKTTENELPSLTQCTA